MSTTFETSCLFSLLSFCLGRTKMLYLFDLSLLNCVWLLAEFLVSYNINSSICVQMSGKIFLLELGVMKIHMSQNLVILPVTFWNFAFGPLTGVKLWPELVYVYNRKFSLALYWIFFWVTYLMCSPALHVIWSPYILFLKFSNAILVRS